MIEELKKNVVIPEKFIARKNIQKVVDAKNGDCFRACITSLLGIENDDSLPTGGDPEWFFNWSKFLNRLGLEIHYEQTACWRSGLWIASVKSKNFENVTHAIIMNSQEVYFDPSPKEGYATGENLLGKNIVSGGWYFEVIDIRRFFNYAIDTCLASKIGVLK